MQTCRSAISRQFATLFSILCLWFAAPVLPAQADVFISPENYQFEQINPLNLTAPPKPVTRQGPGPEAWVKVRFSITEEGTTENIEVLDFMSPLHDAQTTAEAVSAWTFSPAVVAGSPVSWHNNIVLISLDLPEIPNLTGPRFSTPYEAIQQLLSEQRYDRAAREALRNIRDASFTLHDLGLGNVQIATIEMQRGDMYQAYQAIERATVPEINLLTDEELNVALQYRFNIELALRRYMDALDTYERRMALGQMESNDTMHEQASQVLAALDQGYTLNAMGKILDRDTGWFFVPSRRIFTLSDVDGELDSLRAVCNSRIVSLDYQEGVEWTLPESWGECSINVMGDRSTTFTFYEFNPQ